MEKSQPYTADYRREEGTHRFSTVDGVPVTAVSSSSWEDFAGQLDALPPTSGYILTPELMTTPGKLEEVVPSLGTAQERIEAVKDASRRHPEAMVLLGSPTVDEKGKLRNSLVAIRDGQTQGHIDKRGTMWPEEEQLFAQEERSQARLLKVGHAALICSDIITASVVTPPSPRSMLKDARTLLVSANWAIPRDTGLYTPADDEARFGGALHTTVGRLFDGHPDLEEIIVVDRPVENSALKPYTGQFRRTAHTSEAE